MAGSALMGGLSEQNGGGGGVERIYNSCRGEAGKKHVWISFHSVSPFRPKSLRVPDMAEDENRHPVASIFTSSPSFNPIAIDRNEGRPKSCSFQPP